MNTIPQRASRTQEYELEEDNSYYEQRRPTSARRYYDTRGNQVIQQGNKRLVIHQEPRPTRKLHWSVVLGTGMLLMLTLWAGGSLLLNWWQNHQLDSQYGMSRTYQTDAIVYPSDTSDHPSHYLFLNLSGQVIIVELPHDDPTHARIYKGPVLYSVDAGYTPVTGSFQLVNGKIDMIVLVGDQKIVYVNDGTQFKPQ